LQAPPWLNSGLATEPYVVTEPQLLSPETTGAAALNELHLSVQNPLSASEPAAPGAGRALCGLEIRLSCVEAASSFGDGGVTAARAPPESISVALLVLDDSGHAIKLIRNAVVAGREHNKGRFMGSLFDAGRLQEKSLIGSAGMTSSKL
jgi:hypothetical protein